MKNIVFVTIIMIAGCGDDSEDSQICTPGDVKECPCSGGLPNGTQVCEDDGDSLGECDCEPGTGDTEDTDKSLDTDADVDCSGELSVSGSLNTDISTIKFTSAAVVMTHKLDVDPEEDGCISFVDATFTAGSGCNFRVTAGSNFTGLEPPNLEIQMVEFTADSHCPGFSDDQEGTYTIFDMTNADITLADMQVVGDYVDTAPWDTTITVNLEGTLRSGNGKSLKISATAIEVDGCINSSGDTNASCPCIPSCDGKQCGDNGCGGSCGTCPDGRCVDGACVEECAQLECGQAPSGVNCGDCDGGGVCVDNKCLNYWDDGYCPYDDEYLYAASLDCRGITLNGCCDSNGKILACEDNVLFCLDCPAEMLQCSWDTSAGGYLCTDTYIGADPSGVLPMNCDAYENP